MNKWEDSFKKNEAMCHCSNNGLFIPNRQLSIIVAGLLFLAFCIFISGYFLGKKNVVEQYSEKMQQEAFSDQVYASILTHPENSEQQNSPTLLVTQTETQPVELLHEPVVQAVMSENQIVTSATLPEQSSVQYYAQLIGFGTEKAAQQFVKKLAIKGIETEVKKRISTTAKGRTSYWYQVVTAAYSNKNDLIELVNKITKEENIKDANIRVC